MKEKFTAFKEKLKGFFEPLLHKFKNLDTKQRNIVIASAIGVLLILVSLFMMNTSTESKVISPIQPPKQEQNSTGFQPQKLENLPQDFNQTKQSEQNLTKDSHMSSRKNEESNQTMLNVSTKDSNVSKKKTSALPAEQNSTKQGNNLSEEELNLKRQEALSNAAKGESTQEDIIRQLEKQQKPNDMIAFLKTEQSKIQLNPINLTFKYEFKEYKAGDRFLGFYTIEEITTNFIRFADEDYSYNLRFLRR